MKRAFEFKNHNARDEAINRLCRDVERLEKELSTTLIFIGALAAANLIEVIYFVIK